MTSDVHDDSPVYLAAAIFLQTDYRRLPGGEYTEVSITNMNNYEYIREHLNISKYVYSIQVKSRIKFSFIP